MTAPFKVEAVGECEMRISRGFAAPRELAFEAHVRPELVRRWLSAPGWTFKVCRIDARVGGSYRYEWKKESGEERMGMGGEFVELVPEERVVVRERFDTPWYPGTATVTTTFAESNGETTVAMTVRYESREARDGVMASEAPKGVEAGYAKLARLLEEMQGDFR